MIYKHRGHIAFDCRERYFDEGVDRDAIVHLTLATASSTSSNPQPSPLPRR